MAIELIELEIKIRTASGAECVHRLEEERSTLNLLLESIRPKIGSETGGLLTLFRPLGVHKMRDIESIHFIDFQPDDREFAFHLSTETD